jgi:HD-GYP domain-containing protein (c-di-GMP phosphodiesterase class II)
LDHEYSQVSSISLKIENFPLVNIFVKQGQNYTLYKSRDFAITAGDLARLKKSDIEFVYVKDADIDIIRAFFENNLQEIFAADIDKEIPKADIICPIMINYVSEIFKNPESGEFFLKCKSLLEMLLEYILANQEISSLLAKLVHRDVYLFTHSSQVAVMSMFVHSQLFTIDHDELIDIGLGGMIQDIGMIYVSNSITESSDPLSKTEYFRVRKHPQQGHDLLVKLGITSPIPLTITLNHHERYNGTGYPCHLFGNEIPRSVQVTSICDVYCALITERPYRPASTSAEAMNLLWLERTVFNEGILDRFMTMMGHSNRQNGEVSIGDLSKKYETTKIKKAFR